MLNPNTQLKTMELLNAFDVKRNAEEGQLKKGSTEAHGLWMLNPNTELKTMELLNA